MTANKKKTFTIIVLSVMAAAVIGFIKTTSQKSSHIIFEKTGSSKDFNTELNLEKGSNYMFSFWVIDEESSYEWANASAKFTIIVNGKVIHEKEAHDTNSDDSGGFKRAQNGFDFSYNKIIKDSKAEIIVKMSEGDSWDVKIYKNLSEADNFMPVVYIFIFIIALVALIKIRNKTVNTENT